MPSAVSTERRLERSTLRNGMRTMLLPKSGSRRCRRRVPAGAIAVLRIASTGGTRTARATGQAIATSDDEHAERRALRERSGLESRLPHREREVAPEHVADEVVDEQPDADAEHHAAGGDLEADEQRAQRDAQRGRAERHRDADLASLRLDDPHHEVERAERRAREQHGREDRVEPPGAVDRVQAARCARDPAHACSS